MLFKTHNNIIMNLIKNVNSTYRNFIKKMYTLKTDDFGRLYENCIKKAL